MSNNSLFLYSVLFVGRCQYCVVVRRFTCAYSVVGLNDFHRKLWCKCLLGFIFTPGFVNVRWIIEVAPYEDITHCLYVFFCISAALLGDVDVSALAEFLREYPRFRQPDNTVDTTELFDWRGEVLSPRVGYCPWSLSLPFIDSLTTGSFGCLRLVRGGWGWVSYVIRCYGCIRVRLIDVSTSTEDLMTYCRQWGLDWSMMSGTG